MPVLSENSENAVIRTFLYLSGFQRRNRKKAFNIKHFRRIRSIPKLPSKIAKQPLIHKTRNQVVAQAARGFESHPVRQKAFTFSSVKAFLYFVNILSTKVISNQARLMYNCFTDINAGGETCELKQTYDSRQRADNYRRHYRAKIQHHNPKV